ncbi:hypothetical protein DPMN_048858 [Dreissena polymorpha]|uniref:Uncharacterized protein n=1 Tax=Dreissena polymorpha TaxID=45954 RepID=A0A9D4DAR8_DREPO|nr:hypothetical protein DPMN_048858 [Dreissena polymorpha]
MQFAVSQNTETRRRANHLLLCTVCSQQQSRTDKKKTLVGKSARKTAKNTRPT